MLYESMAKARVLSSNILFAHIIVKFIPRRTAARVGSGEEGLIAGCTRQNHRCFDTFRRYEILCCMLSAGMIHTYAVFLRDMQARRSMGHKNIKTVVGVQTFRSD